MCRNEDARKSQCFLNYVDLNSEKQMSQLFLFLSFVLLAVKLLHIEIHKYANNKKIKISETVS